MFTIWYPYIFLLLPIIAIIWYLLDNKNLWNIFPNSVIAKYCKYDTYNILMWIFRIIAIFWILGLLSGTIFQKKVTESIPEKQNIMIILDISRSMLAEDMKPNRMEVAKKYLENFLDSRKSDSIGLIVFAGKPFTLISGTDDKTGLQYFLNQISPSYIFQEKPWLSGTNIWDALVLWKEELQKKSWKKIIILITDWTPNIGSNPITNAKEIIKDWIQLFAIGIGAKNNLPLVYTNENWQEDYFYDQNGDKIKWDLNDSLLQEIAKIWKWKYFSGEDSKKLEMAFEETNKNIGNNFTMKETVINFSLLPIFVIIFLLAIVISKYFERKFYKKYWVI